MKVCYLAFTLLLLVGCSPSNPQENIDLAKEYLAKNNTSAAIIELKNAIQKAPQSAEARFELGKVYLKARQFEDAEKELTRAMEFNFDYGQLLPKLARAYRHTESFVLLSKIDNNLAELSDADKSEIGYYKLIALTRLGKTSERVELLEQLNTLDATLPFVVFANANELIVTEDLDAALSVLTKLDGSKGGLEELLKLKGHIYLQNNDSTNALLVYQEYIDNFPEDNDAIFLYSSILVSVQQFDKAEEYIDQLLKINSQHPFLNRQKSIVRASRNDYAGAKAYAEKAIQNGNEELTVRLIAGYAAYKLEQFEQAIRHLSRIASELPPTHLGLRVLASSQLKLGLTLEAKEIVDSFGELSSQDLPLLSAVGFNLLKKGYSKEAAAYTKKAASLSVSGDDLTRVGLLQFSQDDDQAIINLEKALAELPESDNNWQILATAYFTKKKYQEALELAAKWKLQSPNELTAYLLAGAAYAKLNQFENARIEYESAQKIESNSVPIKMALVYLLLTQENYSEALKSVENILLNSPDYAGAYTAYYLINKSQGNVEKALQRAIDAQRKYPNSSELKYATARLLITEKRYSDAKTLIGRLDNNIQASTELWNLKAIALVQGEFAAESEQHFISWLKQYPNDKTAILGQLMIFYDKNQYKDGIKLADSALLAAEDVRISFLRAHFLVMDNNFAAARIAYFTLPKSIQDSPLGKGIKARLQINHGFIKEALPNAKEAYQFQPSNNNLKQLLYCQERLGNSAEAYKVIEEHVANYPSTTEIMLLYAERQMSRDKDAALLTYKNLLTVVPQNPVVLNNLANIYMSSKDFPQAKIHAEQAVKLAPNTPEVWDTLAQIYVKQGDYKNALESYSNINTDQAPQENIFLNHVEALMASGDIDSASTKLKSRTLATSEAKIRSEKLIKEYNI
ncbi:MAG: putative PEP-CTERM system TPR-repeat lipoprotein [Paraglaciecola sp.]|jgi:putative PEP-CTERM system TPR-repeat lipoprotein